MTAPKKAIDGAIRLRVAQFISSPFVAALALGIAVFIIEFVYYAK
jgi:hypothetical protein